MAKVSVAEAADRLGVNAQRVHQRIADGSLSAERIGHQWVIDEADLARLDARPAGRPLSSKSAWSLAIVAAALEADGSLPSLAPDSAGHLNPPAAKAGPSIAAWDRSRARARMRQLLQKGLALPGRDDEPQAADIAASLRSLLRNRAQRRSLRASSRDLAELRSDRRINLSGISLPSSGIASADIVEGYLAEGDIDDVAEDFLLSGVSHSAANVVLHVFDPDAIPDGALKPDNWLLLAVDLAEHHSPREIAKAAQIVRAVAASTYAGEKESPSP